MNNIKYTYEDIKRIYNELCDVSFVKSLLKKGIIAEWVIKFPNGNKFSDVVFSCCVDESNFDEELGKSICVEKIQKELWKICGLYSTITNMKL